MARRTKEEAAETRRRVLDAALTVFSAKGYSRTTFVDIANEIDLTKGAVYWHFKSKPDLLAALISHGEQKHCARIIGTRHESLKALRAAIMEIAEEVVSVEKVRTFEFFTGFQIEWSSGLIAEVDGKLQELRGDPLDGFGNTLAHLQACGELRADADIRELAMMMASFWVGSLHLMLKGKLDPAEFVALQGWNFDLVVGRHALHGE